ncbi:efflux RND transporter periplasmic adaptor subunit [Methylomagnum sp.]
MFLRRTALLLSLVIACPAWADDDDDEARETPRSAAPTARPNQTPTAAQAGTVRLTAGRQTASGLAVETLRAVSFQPEATTYAKALDIQPLLALRVRHRAAQTDAEVAAAALNLAEKNRARLTSLHQAEIIASRELAQADAQWRADQARETAARRLMGEIRREAEHAWGVTLARLALDGDAPLLNDLAAHRRVLLLAALPTGQAAPSQSAGLFISRGSDRARAIRAELISPAPATDELVQGETWFFHAPADNLRAGMRVNAWSPLGGGTLEGVFVPLSAVVWQDGKPWIYRRVGGDGFARVEIGAHREYGGGWFVAQGLAAGESIVVTGGQMLLSEEFRGRIPDEDDD